MRQMWQIAAFIDESGLYLSAGEERREDGARPITSNYPQKKKKRRCGD